MDTEDLYKKAQQMHNQLEGLQKSLADIPLQGSAGNGSVSITINGNGELLDIILSPTLLQPDKAQHLRTLILQAFSQANLAKNEMIKRETKMMLEGNDFIKQ